MQRCVSGRRLFAGLFFAARHAEKGDVAFFVSMATRGDWLPAEKCMGRGVIVMPPLRRQPSREQLLAVHALCFIRFRVELLYLLGVVLISSCLYGVYLATSKYRTINSFLTGVLYLQIFIGMGVIIRRTPLSHRWLNNKCHTSPG